MFFLISILLYNYYIKFKEQSSTIPMDVDGENNHKTINEINDDEYEESNDDAQSDYDDDKHNDPDYECNSEDEIYSFSDEDQKCKKIFFLVT